ncbi:elongation factor P maturation arginine rhamnosyltransferase EarP [Candidatus Symbiobacter mobilis]|nr:elongation factor P maturation arginine rhamnosyltransferase EarP [Candidatus Symbiobacter mobilis]
MGKVRQRWDVFCQVIDNWGDIGVSWRLATHLAQRGQRVRLWIDEPEALAWMAPQGPDGVEVRRWTTPIDMTDLTPGDVLVEAFGCEIPEEFITEYVRHLGASPARWFNLEYLSAQNYAARCHGLPSPVSVGAGKGLVKRFCYPGFTAQTGGLLHEDDLLPKLERFDRAAWFDQQGIAWHPSQTVWSLFCYATAPVRSWLDALSQSGQRTLVLVTDGIAARLVREALAHGHGASDSLHVYYLQRLSQQEFDHLLWSSDGNVVRGEDSLVRAIWAGKPMLWQAYPQEDGAHHAKLHAVLDAIGAPPLMRAVHAWWNGSTPALPGIAWNDWPAWLPTMRRARSTLLALDDLTDTLLRWAA